MHTTREIVTTFFDDVPNNSKGEQTNSKFKCSCGTTRTQDLKKGLTNLISHIKNAEFESTTILLQEQQRSLSEVRAIFNAMLSKYPEMERHISERGGIVHSPDFENGLVKLQDEIWEDLAPEEESLMLPFLLENSDVQLISPTKPSSLAAAALKTKKRKIVSCPYINVSQIPPTSNIVERLFSSARLVLTDYRKSMTPNCTWWCRDLSSH